jgi:glycosyltransferase involved in cell wall biosynthesis
MTVSVIVPVKDGARHLGEVLDAVAGQQIDDEIEVLVVDSGSTDGSLEIARAHGATVLEIPAAEFGHGRTRNLAAERAAGDRIAFLTQDATPAGETWLARLIEPLDAHERIGLAFGPHLPRPGTSPMIARELTEFFGGFSAGEVRVDDRVREGDAASGFFSNVNSAVLRECWEQVRFRDLEYAEDQAFARDAMSAGWRKAFLPEAAVLHAHDYGWREFMRRYFDEYRGLRESTGHVERLQPRRVAAQVRADARYMRAAGLSPAQSAAWTGRSLRHHAGRALFSSLGSRADRLGPRMSRRLSLEGRGGGRAPAEREPAIRHGWVRPYFEQPAAPLAAPSPTDAQRPLHFAWLVPPFRRGSGGHMTLFTIARELEQAGHSCSVWVHDPERRMHDRAAVAQRELVDHFAPLRAGVFDGFADWHGADVAFATGWQTAYPLWTLAGCKLKAYLVQDFEPDFYSASAERVWAEETYRMGYACVAASPWLAGVLEERYGATADVFELGVDLDTYRPLEVPRRDDTVVFYARRSTPRRATELGLLALDELVRRRPGLRVVLFGDTRAPRTPFPHEFGGVLDAQALARLYNEATAGLVISLTNYSRMPKEMMACGLPVVDVDHPSVLSAFDAPQDVIELARPDLLSIADRLDALLGDERRRSALSEAARQFVSGMTWQAAAAQVEAAVRRRLAERWTAAQSRSASVGAARR